MTTMSEAQMKNCKVCDKEFKPKATNAKYCKECRDSGAFRRNKEPFKKERVCKECGDTYTATGKNQKYCSKECGSPRKYHLQRVYGITLKQHAKMEDSFGKKCMICGTEKNVPVGERGRNYHSQLCIDHDHTTGKIRGLLCNPCNTAIGQLKDSKELLLKAIDYLDSSEERATTIENLLRE